MAKSSIRQAVRRKVATFRRYFALVARQTPLRDFRSVSGDFGR
jgi:hypothetical protein